MSFVTEQMSLFLSCSFTRSRPFPWRGAFLKANLFVVTGFVVLLCFVGQHVLPPLIGGSVYHASRVAAASHYTGRNAGGSWSSLLGAGSL